MNVLVAHSYFLRLDPKQWTKMRPYPPLATMYVAANLRAAGHEVHMFDAMLANDEYDFKRSLDNCSPEVVVLYEDNFNFLSKMCLTRMRDAALAMTAMARAVGAAVIAAGSDVTDHPEVYLDGGVHIAVQGEGDHTVRELVDQLSAGVGIAQLSSIAGTVQSPASMSSLVRGPTRRNEPRPDVFGHPARDLVDITEYARLWREHHGRFSLNMVSTRGCPFHCNWCAKPIWGQRYAMRSPGDVAAELAEVKRAYSPDHIWFADDIFGLRPSWVTAFASEVAGA